MTKKPPVKKRPGRPATGRTPDAERKAKSRASLAEAGGKRLDVHLTADGAADLGTIMLEHGLTETQAVHAALATHRTRLKK